LTEQFISYHNRYLKGGEEELLKNWPFSGYYTIDNLQRRVDGYLDEPVLSQTSKDSSLFIGILTEDGNMALAPSKRLHRNLSAVLSGEGHQKDAYLKGIFKTIEGDQFELLEPAIMGQNRKIRKPGRLIIRLATRSTSSAKSQPDYNEPSN
jgi:hypothetical protein